MKKHTLSSIKKASLAAGHYWFTKNAIAFFNTTFHSQVDPYGFFITGERMREEDYEYYAIRRYNPVTNDIETIGSIREYATVESAQKEIFRMIREDGIEKI